jgi:transcription termination factor NusB
MHLIFAREMAKHGYDVGEVFANALKEENWKLLEKLEKFIPYCFVQLRAKEFDIKPNDPIESKLTIDERIELARSFTKPNGQSGANLND